MTNKITHAPQEVIKTIDTANYASPRDLMLVIDEIEPVDKWVYEDMNAYVDKQLSLINHVFGNEKLRLEREPEYIVEDNGGYFYIESGLLQVDSTESNSPSKYQGMGMKKEQADGLVKLFGGIVVEVAEREPRWYVTKVAPWNNQAMLVYSIRTGVLSETIVNGKAIMTHSVSYDNGISEQLADAIVAEIGGEKVEIK